MAEKKKAEAAPVSDYVTIQLPRVKGESESQFVALNGKTYLIKKGVPVNVPKGVAEIIANKEQMEMEALSFIDANTN